MNKQITSIFLVAGTCIGAGMIALPISMAKIGIIPSVIIIFLTWFFTYYCSLINLELTLRSKMNDNESLPLEFSGRGAKFIDDCVVKMLSTFVMAAYFYGCSSIIQELLNYKNIFLTQTLLLFLIIFLFLFPKRAISKVNNIVFIVFISLFFLLLIRIVVGINFLKTPLIESLKIDFMPSIISLIFTSFGYQLIFYTIKDLCNNDVKMMRRAFFYGSLIPTIVYVLWICCSLAVIYSNNVDFYNLMINSSVEVGDLIREISLPLNIKWLQILIYLISIFTIFTSIIGVGLGLYESICKSIGTRTWKSRLVSLLITMVPPYLISVVVPNAFINVLNFAGVFLIIICVLIPVYLYFRADIKTPHFKILNRPVLIFFFIASIILTLCSLFFL